MNTQNFPVNHYYTRQQIRTVYMEILREGRMLEIGCEYWEELADVFTA